MTIQNLKSQARTMIDGPHDRHDWVRARLLILELLRAMDLQDRVIAEMASELDKADQRPVPPVDERCPCGFKATPTNASGFKFYRCDSCGLEWTHGQPAELRHAS